MITLVPPLLAAISRIRRQVASPFRASSSRPAHRPAPRLARWWWPATRDWPGWRRRIRPRA